MKKTLGVVFMIILINAVYYQAQAFLVIRHGHNIKISNNSTQFNTVEGTKPTVCLVSLVQVVVFAAIVAFGLWSFLESEDIVNTETLRNYWEKSIKDFRKLNECIIFL